MIFPEYSSFLKQKCSQNSNSRHFKSISNFHLIFLFSDELIGNLIILVIDRMHLFYQFIFS